jgi:tRNA A-37 threonylcarbamoyl transferase component Bud32/DNA-binding response OmpR family regulator
MPRRLLIITEQTEFARLLEYHVATFWDDAESRLHNPRDAGPLHPAFTAAAYDAVLLDDDVDDAQGLTWLKNFRAHHDFPPILFFARGKSSSVTQAEKSGAASVFLRERIDHQQLRAALREAVDRRQQELKLLRAKPDQVKRYRFGPVTIRGQRLISEIGAGGTAHVYLAESEKAGEIVVLKVLGSPDAVDPHKLFERFLREYEVLSKIRHPNVVRIDDLGIADDHAYLAMEYFPKGDLKQRLVGPMPIAEAISIFEQIARALAAVHAVGVLHRDLKPGNVMLRNDGTIALIDFGVAKEIAQNTAITAAGAIFGTPYYMSPEQGHGEPVDARSDLYSLGVMLYEMLTQKKPFVATSAMQLIYMHRNAPIPELPAESAGWQPLANRLLAKNPADRFQTASELIAELERLQHRRTRKSDPQSSA